MKKSFAFLMVLVILASFGAPALAKSNDAWLDSTDLIDYDEAVAEAFVKVLVAGAGNKTDEERRILDFVDKNYSLDENVRGVRCYSEILAAGCEYYVGDVRFTAKANSVEISVVTVGMLRSRGIPARVLTGWRQDGRNWIECAWVELEIGSSTYWDDPARATKSSSAFRHMTDTERRNYDFDEVLDEYRYTPEVTERTRVDIPLDKRYDTKIDIITNKGKWNEKKASISLTMVDYDAAGKRLMPATVCGSILGLKVEWDSRRDTAVFREGGAVDPVGRTISDKSAQVWLIGKIWVEKDGRLIQTDSDGWLIDGVTFVCFNDVAKAVGSDARLN